MPVLMVIGDMIHRRVYRGRGGSMMDKTALRPSPTTDDEKVEVVCPRCRVTSILTLGHSLRIEKQCVAHGESMAYYGCLTDAGGCQRVRTGSRVTHA